MRVLTSARAMREISGRMSEQLQPVPGTVSAAGDAISVLVADDHADSLAVLAALLRISGYTVHTAGTLSEASAVASHRHCDLLVGDIQFSDGSGLDLMRELNAKYGLPGIALSGYAEQQDVDAALQAGFARHLAKPVIFAALLDAVRELTAGCATGQRTPGGAGTEVGGNCLSTG